MCHVTWKPSSGARRREFCHIRAGVRRPVSAEAGHSTRKVASLPTNRDDGTSSSNSGKRIRRNSKQPRAWYRDHLGRILALRRNLDDYAH
ncbi:jg11142 [Pararge aegeria aegeria]|uniref:Jg11142 protein n=1 Tax=Pararge aegeria aegeria TaxID=348720 RepID=A0A8S4RLZ2_9NEOP|nr:jg11142 [Pararge aegeria aegeria]